MAPTPETLGTLRRYWAGKLGVDADAFEATGVTVGAGHGDDVEVFVRDDAVVVGAPPALHDACERATGGLARAVPDDEAVGEWIGARGSVRTVLGPAFYGYVDRRSFEPVDATARPLDAADEAAVDRLRAAVPDEEWDQGGPAFEPGRTVGRFVDGDLVAVAGYDVWDDLVAHVAVVTHPDHRGEGNGRAAVSRVTAAALDDGLLPQYRTADAWPWSVALAEGLGYERFATSCLGVRDA